MSSEIDLIPDGYRALNLLQARLTRIGLALLLLLTLLGGAKLGLVLLIRSEQANLQNLSDAQTEALARKARFDAQRQEDRILSDRLKMLEALRGTLAAREMFQIVDRALDDRVWFLDWKFSRLGDVVDESVTRTGYFVVIPASNKKEKQRAWRMQTHMEIRAQASDHSALADFVRRLVAQPEVDDARVISTHIGRGSKDDVVDFELAVVVKSRA